MQNVLSYTLLIILSCITALPQACEARHNDRIRIDRDSLDDEPVAEFMIPVLFDVELSDVFPDFGDPRGGGTREHEGQDFRAPKGTPIVSPTEAIVIRTGSGDSAGRYVYTANPGGETFRYMHLDEIGDLDPGDQLDVGDFIGTVGDTGNAPDGIYHLHFEVRNEDNDPTDPYERLEGSFSVKEKMSFLRDVFSNISDDDEYAAFLVETFSDDFSTALVEGYDLHYRIENALEDTELGTRVSLLAQLDEIIDSIPAVVTQDLRVGDQGSAVALLQTYLLFRSGGDAHTQLAAAGATGYYGSLTAAAVREYQRANDLEDTGVWTHKHALRQCSSPVLYNSCLCHLDAVGHFLKVL